MYKHPYHQPTYLFSRWKTEINPASSSMLAGLKPTSDNTKPAAGVTHNMYQEYMKTYKNIYNAYNWSIATQVRIATD